MAAPVFSRPAGASAPSHRAIRRREPGRSAALDPALRRRGLLPLLYRRLTQSEPALVRRGAVWPRRSDRATPRAPALTTTEPLRYFQRTQETLGSRYRLERTVAVTAEQVLFEAYDQILKRRV